MKYICLGYIEPGKFEGMTEDERHTVLDKCFEHNDHLRANGHLVAEVPLQPSETALTLYWKNGKVATTGGPYAETKEQVGGIQILEARDFNHAVQLVSQPPGFKYGLGPIEIRPVVDLSEIIKESERRRRKDTSRWGRSLPFEKPEDCAPENTRICRWYLPSGFATGLYRYGDYWV